MQFISVYSAKIMHNHSCILCPRGLQSFTVCHRYAESHSVYSVAISGSFGMCGKYAPKGSSAHSATSWFYQDTYWVLVSWVPWVGEGGPGGLSIYIYIYWDMQCHLCGGFLGNGGLAMGLAKPCRILYFPNLGQLTTPHVYVSCCTPRCTVHDIKHLYTIRYAARVYATSHSFM